MLKIFSILIIISNIFAEVSYEDLSNALNQYDPLYKSLNYEVSEVLPGWQTIDSKIFDELSKSLDSIPVLSEKIKKYKLEEFKLFLYAIIAPRFMIKLTNKTRGYWSEFKRFI